MNFVLASIWIDMQYCLCNVYWLVDCHWLKAQDCMSKEYTHIHESCVCVCVCVWESMDVYVCINNS